VARILAEHTHWLVDAFGLLCSGLGQGAYTENGLQALAQNPRALLLGAMLTVNPGPLVGAAVVEQLYCDELSYYTRFGAGALALLGRHTVGSLAGIAVQPSLRGQGIGQGLMAGVIGWLRQEGCDLLITISWVSRGPNPSRPLFEKLGFTYVAEVPDVYLQDSLEHGLVCAYCDGPCHCSGILYMLDLRNKSRLEEA
jgi:GNAT superfamily N-acetyltransferase